MKEEMLENYLKNIEKGEDCENCGEAMKLLQFSWGESETHKNLITVLNTILDEDEMLSDSIHYEGLRLRYCEHCKAVNLSIK